MSFHTEIAPVFELTRKGYLDMARDVARKLLETQESITVNDVRDICPPPKSFDPRVMGALFSHKDFTSTGEFVNSKRSTCHRRPIQKFTLAEDYSGVMS